MKRFPAFLLALLSLTPFAPAQTASDLNEGTTLAHDPVTGTFTFSWWGSAGKTYFIQQSDDLFNWTYVPTYEIGADQVIEWGFTSTASRFFLRLELQTTGGVLPDRWQQLYFGHTGALPDEDEDGDGLSNLEEFLAGTDPTDFFNGQQPVVTKSSGDAQTGNPNGFVPAPLVVSVTDAVGNPLANAPVMFSILSGGGQLQASSSGTPTNSLTLRTGIDGLATAFFRLPNTPYNASEVAATAGNFNPPSQVIFNESSDDGNGSHSSPFAPSNVAGTVNPDGSEDLTWTTNTDDQNPIPIWKMQDDGTWLLIATVPAGTTSFHLPAQ